METSLSPGSYRRLRWLEQAFDVEGHTPPGVYWAGMWQGPAPTNPGDERLYMGQAITLPPMPKQHTNGHGPVPKPDGDFSNLYLQEDAFQRLEWWHLAAKLRKQVGGLDPTFVVLSDRLTDPLDLFVTGAHEAAHVMLGHTLDPLADVSKAVVARHEREAWLTAQALLELYLPPALVGRLMEHKQDVTNASRWPDAAGAIWRLAGHTEQTRSMVGVHLMGA